MGDASVSSVCKFDVKALASCHVHALCGMSIKIDEGLKKQFCLPLGRGKARSRGSRLRESVDIVAVPGVR